MSTSSKRLQKRRAASTYLGSSPSSRRSSVNFDPLSWLFRTNIPKRRSSPMPNDVRKRNLFGLGEIIGVITNPAETVRSLTESKRLLEEARRDIIQSRERAQIRPKHTFSRLPGFFPREAEVKAVQRALQGEPSFTVLFGASSVGKTALLREVLCSDDYHVLHFDLRIAGFADLASLYFSLSEQMEQYFEDLAQNVPGYKEFEKEAWGFKHDRLNVERRLGISETVAEVPPIPGYMRTVRTSDIARLMELFQSSLLKYWEFQPPEQNETVDTEKRASAAAQSKKSSEVPSQRSRWTMRGRRSNTPQLVTENRQPAEGQAESGQDIPKAAPKKKTPVFFLDEAHKLPALIKSTETMKSILDSMLVLTKQDRLCHVIHATSDPFYQTWLRQLNVMQHCKVITIGDCSKDETRVFFDQRMLPSVPEHLKDGLDFEELFDAFGGKLAHWLDYVSDYVNVSGHFSIHRSSHFLQAHALLNLHVIHSSQMATATDAKLRDNDGDDNTLHPGLGPAGFKIYSPITHPHGPGASSSHDNPDAATTMTAGAYSADFSAMDLLKVMSRLSQPGVGYIPYFALCREMGVRAVDGLVKGRVLDLRWTSAVTPEDKDLTAPRARISEGSSQLQPPRMSSAAALENGSSSFEAGAILVSPQESQVESRMGEIDDVIGPRLLPTTPIMRYAMREVVQEYEDGQSVSEYASLSEVEEY